ncbi:MAG: OmpA family protein [Pirellulales bacterium]|nr:OmpA family protein [Pirellulales bacterium]
MPEAVAVRRLHIVRLRAICCALALAPVCAVGCSPNQYALQGQVQNLQQQQVAVAQQHAELQTRATALDQDNQELERLLAQSQQQVRLLEDQLLAVRDQLKSTTTQLADVRDRFENTDERARTLAASLRKRGGAEIQANSSLSGTLPGLNLPGVEVRRDGDVVRVELPGNRLFVSGSARLLPEAGTLVEQVAAEITRAYPDRIVGVEGHTDSDPVTPGQWANNHQLSVGRAMAIYDHLLARCGMRPEQLMVVGHGSNHPVVSNATAAGKERNRRVELVIYPDRVANR